MMAEKKPRAPWGTFYLVLDEVAEHLESGYVLTVKDVQEISEKHGMSPSSAPLGSIVAGAMEKRTGVPGESVRLREKENPRNKVVFYYDSRLDPYSDTDLLQHIELEKRT